MRMAMCGWFDCENAVSLATMKSTIYDNRGNIQHISRRFLEDMCTNYIRRCVASNSPYASSSSSNWIRHQIQNYAITPFACLDLYHKRPNPRNIPRMSPNLPTVSPSAPFAPMTFIPVEPMESNAEKVRQLRPESAIILNSAAQIARINMNKCVFPNLVAPPCGTGRKAPSGRKG